MQIIEIDEIVFDAQFLYQLPRIDILDWKDMVPMLVVISAVLIRTGFSTQACLGLIIKRYLIAAFKQAQSGDHPC